MSDSHAYQNQVEADNNSFFLGLPAAEIKSRSVGSFFSFFEDICWSDNELPISPSNFPVIRRTADFGKSIYPNTADEGLLDMCDEADSLQSDTTNTNQRVTTVDFLYNLEE